MMDRQGQYERHCKLTVWVLPLNVREFCITGWFTCTRTISKYTRNTKKKPTYMSIKFQKCPPFSSIIRLHACDSIRAHISPCVLQHTCRYARIVLIIWMELYILFFLVRSYTMWLQSCAWYVKNAAKFEFLNMLFFVILYFLHFIHRN